MSVYGGEGEGERDRDRWVCVYFTERKTLGVLDDIWKQYLFLVGLIGGTENDLVLWCETPVFAIKRSIEIFQFWNTYVSFETYGTRKTTFDLLFRRCKQKSGSKALNTVKLGYNELGC